MSPSQPPSPASVPGESSTVSPIDRVHAGALRDLGGFSVRRVLPEAQHRRVGPFVFFDHFGPVMFPPGTGVDVRPHPHIGLATVTYLFDGEIVHRDSLGSHQTIRPGEINWMIAGRGIVHSERTGEQRRRTGGPSHGIQCWIALPTEHEQDPPGFQHHPGDSLAVVRAGDTEVRVLLGTAYGETAPATVLSPMFYAEAKIPAGATLTLPDAYPERAVYIVEGDLDVGTARHSTGTMVVFRPDVTAQVRAHTPVRAMLLGGDGLAGERHLWWNLVSSTSARIEEAKADWREGRFPKVPDDEQEFIPLPPG